MLPREEVVLRSGRGLDSVRTIIEESQHEESSIPLSFVFLLADFVASNAMAQSTMIYPAKGQSQGQMDKDKSECYSWAKQQTGFDPMQAASQPPPPSQPAGGERVKGAVRGAAVGAVVGEIANDDAGKGAAAGAVGGVIVGGMKKRDQQRQQAQAQQQQSAAAALRQNDYNRAFGVCMDGRCYTVK
jgi:hypothetical protein